MADHAEVGDFDASVAVGPAQLDAAAEIAVGTRHTALRIGGIAKAPERAGLQFVAIRPSGVIDGQRVLCGAAFDAT